MQFVVVKSIDGEERRLVLVRCEGKLAFVCAEHHYAAAVADPDDQYVIGVPMESIKLEAMTS